jgi:hypothetical protein
MKRKSRTCRWSADDILYIPDNSGRRTACRLEKIVMFGSESAPRHLRHRALTQPNQMPQEKLDRNVPVVIPGSRVLRPQSNGQRRPGWDLEPEEPAVPLSHYLWIVKRHRWKILAFVSPA